MARINFSDLTFDNAETPQYVYVYDEFYRFKYKHLLEINYSNGEFIVPINSTDIPMNLSIEEGYVAVYDPVERVWNKKKDVWGKIYYYKETGEIVTTPDPDRMSEYTESPKLLPNGVYNEEVDKFIYPVDEYREMLSRTITDDLSSEADEDFILTTDNHKVAVSYLVESNLKQALLTLVYGVNSGTGEPILTVPFDTYPVEKPTSIGEVVEPDPRNEVINIDSDEVDRLMVLLQEKFTSYSNKYTERSNAIKNMPDEEVISRQVEEIKNGNLIV